MAILELIGGGIGMLFLAVMLYCHIRGIVT